MFRPISFNVIRQALEWHSMPIPQLRVLSFSDHDPECVTAEYLAIWDEWLIPQRYFGPQHGGAVDGEHAFYRDLAGCFCDDVRILEFLWSERLQQIRALLYVRVDRTLIPPDALFA